MFDFVVEFWWLLFLVCESGMLIWVDVYDYDGVVEFYCLFLVVVYVVFCNVDWFEDLVVFFYVWIVVGVYLVVCIWGVDGVVVVDEYGIEYWVCVLLVEVVDINGVGDVFFVGVFDVCFDGVLVVVVFEVGVCVVVIVLCLWYLYLFLDLIFYFLEE